MNMFNSNMLGMGSMFGANSFGLGGSSFLGSIWGSNLSSPFMNCNGTVNYDAMAWAGIGNFLTNFLLNTVFFERVYKAKLQAFSIQSITTI